MPLVGRKDLGDDGDDLVVELAIGPDDAVVGLERAPLRVVERLAVDISNTSTCLGHNERAGRMVL